MNQDLINKTLLFYDGECGVCNRSVQFILKHEKAPTISFVALQSEVAKQFFEENNFQQPDLSTFYFYESYHLFDKSEAAFRVLGHLKWYLYPIFIFKLIPVCQRNQLYDWVSRNRKKMLKSFCVLPTPAQLSRFLS